MRYQLFCTAAAFAVTMLLAPRTDAQPAPRPQDCTGKPGVDWNQQVKACTALIEAAQGSPQDRAKVYKSRASAYFGLGDDDRAMADDDAAIRLDPNMAAAYSGRGDIYMDRECDWRITRSDQLGSVTTAIHFQPSNLLPVCSTWLYRFRLLQLR